MSDDEVRRTIISSAKESIRNEITKDTTIAVKEYVNGKYDIIVMQDNMIMSTITVTTKKQANDKFVALQKEYFNKVTQTI